MSTIYRRPALAQRMAGQLLKPGPLDEGLRSGLFLSGVRRTGKTTFLRNDLIPALEEAGALVIYVDLWSDVQASPAALVQAAIAKKLEEIQSPATGLLRRLKRLTEAEVEAFGIKFGFSLDAIGKEGGPTLAEALTALVDLAKMDAVLIVDEVQQAITTDEGNQLLLALKAARDAINPRPRTPGHFIFVGTGSHRAHVNELTTRRNQAFAGATSVPYPLLERDYIAYLIDRLDRESAGRWPSLDVAYQAFQTLGNRPEEMLKALRLMHQQIGTAGDPDQLLPVIAATLRATAADIELAKVEQLGSLAVAIFDRITQSPDNARGIFSTEAAAAYSAAIGREVRVEEIQPVVNALVAENIMMRPSQGRYSVTDPFVQEIWNERKALTRQPDGGGN